MRYWACPSVQITSQRPEELERLRETRRLARARAWEMGAAPTEIVLDFDASLITAHSEKEGASGNYKGGFGFYPLFCYLDQSREMRSTGQTDQVFRGKRITCFG